MAPSMASVVLAHRNVPMDSRCLIMWQQFALRKDSAQLGVYTHSFTKQTSPITLFRSSCVLSANLPGVNLCCTGASTFISTGNLGICTNGGTPTKACQLGIANQCRAGYECVRVRVELKANDKQKILFRHELMLSPVVHKQRL